MDFTEISLEVDDDFVLEDDGFQPAPFDPVEQAFYASGGYGFTTYGIEAGCCDHKHFSREEAHQCIDAHVCRYNDRLVYPLDKEGYI